MHQIYNYKNALGTILCRKENTLVPYATALREMQTHVEDIIAYKKPEFIWFLSHPPTYTAGRSAQKHEVLDIGATPLHHIERGGRVTYHGPGQLVGYLLIDLRQRRRDIRHFVHNLEQWMVNVLAELGVEAQTYPDRIGIWVTRARGTPLTSEEKIGAIGLKVKKWVTFHGFAFNINPDLTAFSKIVPCGLSDYKVTSLEKLSISMTPDEIITLFRKHLPSFIQAIS